MTAAVEIARDTKPLLPCFVVETENENESEDEVALMVVVNVRHMDLDLDAHEVPRERCPSKDPNP